MTTLPRPTAHPGRHTLHGTQAAYRTVLAQWRALRHRTTPRHAAREESGLDDQWPDELRHLADGPPDRDPIGRRMWRLHDFLMGYVLDVTDWRGGELVGSDG